MANRTNPPHDDVALTSEEHRALAEMERWILRGQPDEADDARAGLPARARSRPARLVARLVNAAPWLAPVGAVLMVATFTTSLVFSLAGALLAAVGLAVTLQRSSLRTWPARRRPPGPRRGGGRR